MRTISILLSVLFLTLQACSQQPGKPTINGKWENFKTERQDGNKLDPQGRPLQIGMILEFKDGYAYDMSFGTINSKEKYVITADTLKIGKFVTTIEKLDNDNLILLDTHINKGFDGKKIRYYFRKSH